MVSMEHIKNGDHVRAKCIYYRDPVVGEVAFTPKPNRSKDKGRDIRIKINGAGWYVFYQVEITWIDVLTELEKSIYL